jgi:hypothetical protein
MPPIANAAQSEAKREKCNRKDQIIRSLEGPQS